MVGNPSLREWIVYLFGMSCFHFWNAASLDIEPIESCSALSIHWECFLPSRKANNTPMTTDLCLQPILNINSQCSVFYIKQPSPLKENYYWWHILTPPNSCPSSTDYTFLFSNFWLKTGYGQQYIEDWYYGLQRGVIQVGNNFAYK